jgi:hypothetical protein
MRERREVWKEAHMVCFKILARCFFRGAETQPLKILSQDIVLGPVLEAGTFGVRGISHYAATSCMYFGWETLRMKMF